MGRALAGVVGAVPRETGVEGPLPFVLAFDECPFLGDAMALFCAKRRRSMIRHSREKWKMMDEVGRASKSNASDVSGVSVTGPRK